MASNFIPTQLLDCETLGLALRCLQDKEFIVKRAQKEIEDVARIPLDLAKIIVSYWEDPLGDASPFVMTGTEQHRAELKKEFDNVGPRLTDVITRNIEGRSVRIYKRTRTREVQEPYQDEPYMEPEDVIDSSCKIELPVPGGPPLILQLTAHTDDRESDDNRLEITVETPHSSYDIMPLPKDAAVEALERFYKDAALPADTDPEDMLLGLIKCCHGGSEEELLAAESFEEVISEFRERQVYSMPPQTPPRPTPAKVISLAPVSTAPRNQVQQLLDDILCQAHAGGLPRTGQEPDYRLALHQLMDPSQSGIVQTTGSTLPVSEQFYGTVSSFMVGTKFCDGMARRGETVYLQHDKSNPFDANLHKVVNVVGTKVGYLEHGTNLVLASLLLTNAIRVKVTVHPSMRTDEDRLPIEIAVYGPPDDWSIKVALANRALSFTPAAAVSPTPRTGHPLGFGAMTAALGLSPQVSTSYAHVPSHPPVPRPVCASAVAVTFPPRLPLPSWNGNLQNAMVVPAIPLPQMNAHNLTLLRGSSPQYSGPHPTWSQSPPIGPSAMPISPSLGHALPSPLAPPAAEQASCERKRRRDVSEKVDE